MPQLLGEFDCKLDAKGRLMVPAALKKQLPESEKEGFIINRGFEKNLVIYPKSVWNDVVAEVSKLNPYDAENRLFVRALTRGATEITLDAAGRVLIPKSLAEYAGLGNDIVLACQLDKVEVWDKKSYEDSFDNIPENFAALAQKVMVPKTGGADGA
ncbi:division/cell wall cluster transcriptional repressor MraZ [Pedobacter aquatilis]|uniref:division/cell wall cluster transcriptional repressor MraZ n=1 Tax=Pedobacter aquatilis TaxID=351343 RepID=UPI0025B470AD|nr:division/cell wall cluster transcriptional repressor MraZ [Pedobacter aquatilis]MDN3586257.1 division/cell wall cluster transcriptional repressor MraZ [Pedobacter aquatilis]